MRLEPGPDNDSQWAWKEENEAAEVEPDYWFIGALTMERAKLTPSECWCSDACFLSPLDAH